MIKNNRTLIISHFIISLCVITQVFFFANSVYSTQPTKTTSQPASSESNNLQPEPGTYVVYDAVGDPVFIYQNTENSGKATDVIFKEINVNTENSEISKKTYHQTGYATWYSPKVGSHGVKMKSNSAAHRTISFHTIVTVKSVSNHKSTKVEILDRGPFGNGRIIDMARAAFTKIYPTSKGVFKATLTWSH